MKIKINRLQNEETARRYNVFPGEPGTVADFPEAGTNVVYFDRYKILDLDGKLVSAGFPVGYGEDENGEEYLLRATENTVKAYKTVRKY